MARIYASLPGPKLSRSPNQAEEEHKGFMTTLLTLSEDISKTRKHSLSESFPSASSPLTDDPDQAMQYILKIIDDLQESQGWDKCFLHDGAYMNTASMDEPPLFGLATDDDGEKVFRGEWAGEAMINSSRSLTVSVSCASSRF